MLLHNSGGRLGHFFENKKWELKLVKFVLHSEMPLTETAFNIVESLMLY